MIAHVAEAGEGKGRVVLRLDPSGQLAPVALEAAMRLAQAFQSEIESLFIEDRRLLDLASFPFAREVPLAGRGGARPVTPSDIERDLLLTATASHRAVAALAMKLHVPFHCRSVRDEPVAALAQVCSECGPWNVVAFAEPVVESVVARLETAFEAIQDATGFVLTGPRARRTQGPVVAVIEELERVPPMMRAAERIASATGGEVRLLLTSPSSETLAWMDGQIRLALGETAPSRLISADTAHGDPGALAEVLRRARAGFVIAQFGGTLVPGSASLASLLASLEGPLFLVR